MSDVLYMNLDDTQTEAVLRWACFRASELFSGPGLHVDEYNSSAEVAAKLVERAEESGKVLTLLDELGKGGVQTQESGHYLAITLAPQWIDGHHSAVGELAVRRKMGETYISKKQIKGQRDHAIEAIEIKEIAGVFWEAVANQDFFVGDPLTPEEERAAIVAYTGLWQLREIAPAEEGDAFRSARLRLRKRLDATDAALAEQAERVSVDA